MHLITKHKQMKTKKKLWSFQKKIKIELEIYEHFTSITYSASGEKINKNTGNLKLI